MFTKKISIVIPALNEEEGIGLVINQVPVAELNNAGYDVEIVVVDNASTDNTAAVAREHGAKVVSQPLRGYGNAYKAGFNNATGDIIVTGDADMTYPFDDTLRLVQILENNNLDFLNTDRLSERKGKAMKTSHIVGNWGLSLVTQVLFRWPFKDSQSGMWIFKRSIWSHLNVEHAGMPFSQEIKVDAFSRGFKCAEVPIVYRSRVGEVKLNAIRDGLLNISQLFLKFVSLKKEGLKLGKHQKVALTEQGAN
jgi:glycosyltransferase involved in cell wall biosynthesis